MEHTNNETLGVRICRLRTEKRLSQGELADLLEVSRQSVSKWETDASVPDLDKLVRLAELFQVSLDYLAAGREPPAPAAPAPGPAVFPVRCAAGIALLCLGGLAVILFTLLGGPLEGLALASPFLLCGVICLAARRHPGLWCGWVAYLLVGGYLSYGTGVRWNAALSTLRSLTWGPPYVFYAALAWALVLAAALLIFATARAFRHKTLDPARGGVVLTAAGWAVWLAALLGDGPLSVLLYRAELPVSLFRLVWAGALIAALAALVCVTAALLRGRRRRP